MHVIWLSRKIFQKVDSVKFVYLILIFTLLVRTIYIIVVPQAPIERDAIQYDSLAKTLAERGEYSYQHEGLPILRRPPVYPFFLAILYRLFGYNHQIVRFVQVLIDVFTCWIVYLIALRIFNRRIVAIVAISLFALYVPFWINVGSILSETLATFLIALFVYALLLAEEKPSKIRYAVTGVILGLASLCRPTTLFFPFLLLIVSFFQKNKTRNVRLIGFLITGMVLTMAPWVIRNYSVSKYLVPISTISGQTVVDGLIRRKGSFDNTKIKDVGKSGLLDIEVEEERKLVHELAELVEGKSEAETNIIQLNFGFEIIKKYPIEYIKLTIRKIPRL